MPYKIQLLAILCFPFSLRAQMGKFIVKASVIGFLLVVLVTFVVIMTLSRTHVILQGRIETAFILHSDKQSEVEDTFFESEELLIPSDDFHLVLNVCENYLPDFEKGQAFVGILPDLDNKAVTFRVNDICPLDCLKAWKDLEIDCGRSMRAFEIYAVPVGEVKDFRTGMSVIVKL